MISYSFFFYIFFSYKVSNKVFKKISEKSESSRFFLTPIKKATDKNDFALCRILTFIKL